MNTSSPSLFLDHLQDAHVSETCRMSAAPGRSARLALDGSEWEAEYEDRIHFRCIRTSGESSAVGVEFSFTNWSTDHYVLMPGSVYAGNRFESRKLDYAPRLPEADTSPDCPTIVSDIHRLEVGEGPSRISLLAGDLAIPAFACFDPATRRGWIVLVREPVTSFGQFGFHFEENLDRTEATLRIQAPGVRETRYDFSGGRIDAGAESPDRGHRFVAGDEVTLVLEVDEFPCDSLQGLFDRLFEMRSRFVAPCPLELPVSAAAGLVEKHFNQNMWWPEAGLYKVWPLEGNNPYQTGWCGGIIAEYALLSLSKDPLTLRRCHEHLDHALSDGVSPSGLLYGKHTPDLRWDSDCWGDEESHPWRRQFTLTRRHGDALFYALKACEVVLAQSDESRNEWLVACRGMADSLCRTWEKWGQWGQFLDQNTGDVLLGNSASGGMIPAALAMANRVFGERRYRDVAIAGGEFLYDNFTARGITTGGPADAMQAPDSESAYALVESYWALYEMRGDRLWLDRAAEAARQFASWVMPYDYPFPEGSEFQRLDIRTGGTIFANSQNSHSAPICTHSGLALFQIFRATGDRSYLDLLASIVNAIPQLVSRDDRPVIAQDGRPLPSGWINERINTSDWDNNVGGVFYGPTWCETALLLTAAEIPSIYARPADGLLVAIDNIIAEWADESHAVIQVINPTNYPANVRLFIERPSGVSSPSLIVGPGARTEISVDPKT